MTQLCLNAFILAGVAFAGVLVSIVRSGQVQAMLTDLVQKALTVA